MIRYAITGWAFISIDWHCELQIAARLELFNYRVIEELYHTQNDEDCLTNLAQVEAQSEQLESKGRSRGWRRRRFDDNEEFFW